MNRQVNTGPVSTGGNISVQSSKMSKRDVNLKNKQNRRRSSSRGSSKVAAGDGDMKLKNKQSKKKSASRRSSTSPEADFFEIKNKQYNKRYSSSRRSSTTSEEDMDVSRSSFKVTDADLPYFCMDVSSSNKLVLSKWIGLEGHNDDLSASCHGASVDCRTLPSARLGKAIAGSHCALKPFNMMFRTWSQQAIISSFEQHHLQKLCHDKTKNDQTASLAADYGHETCGRIMQRLVEGYMDKTIPAKKMTTSQAERDIGMPFAFPLACTMTYAIRRKFDRIAKVMTTQDQFWSNYAQEMVTNGNCTEENLSVVYRKAMGWCGWFLYYSYYSTQGITHMLPLKKLSDQDRKIVIDTIGCLGLKLMNFAFGDEDDSDDAQEETSLAQLWIQVDNIIREQAEILDHVASVNKALSERADVFKFLEEQSNAREQKLRARKRVKSQ